MVFLLASDLELLIVFLDPNDLWDYTSLSLSETPAIWMFEFGVRCEIEVLDILLFVLLLIGTLLFELSLLKNEFFLIIFIVA